jgi:hypothetical protein
MHFTNTKATPHVKKVHSFFYAEKCVTSLHSDTVRLSTNSRNLLIQNPRCIHVEHGIMFPIFIVQLHVSAP